MAPNPGPVPTQPQAIGGICVAGSDCQSGHCAKFAANNSGTCSSPCSGDADCGGAVSGLKCGIGEGGAMTCIPACGQAGVACDNGMPVLCSEAKPELCKDCGCPNGQVCWEGVGCKPLAGLGEACRENGDCQMGNCSVFALVCRVAIGAACTADNCDSCVTTSGGSYCSRECSFQVDCGDGFWCSLQTSDNRSYCRPSCTGPGDATCQGQCNAVAGETNTFSCECSSCQSSSSAPRAFGNGCDQSDQCASGNCLTGHTRSSGFGAGFCTKSCASSAECGMGWTCLNVPCIVSDVDCGQVCAPACDPNKGHACNAGACQLWQNIEGVSVAACGPG